MCVIFTNNRPNATISNFRLIFTVILQSTCTKDRENKLENVTIATALQLEVARRRASRSELFWANLYCACARTTTVRLKKTSLMFLAITRESIVGFS